MAWRLLYFMACAFMQLFYDLKWGRIIIAAMTIECFDKNINVVECFLLFILILIVLYLHFICLIRLFM